MNKNIIPVLTEYAYTIKLNLLSKKTEDGIQTPNITGQKAANYAVFLCPSKTQAGLFRLKSVLVGCIGQLSSWPVPVTGSLNPIQPATQRFRPKGGGYLHITGATTMNTSVQNPAKSHPETNQETNLIDICQEIGGITDSNCHYTAGLSRRIQETGKTVEQLTVAELLQLHREHNEWFNSVYGGGL